MSTIWSAIANQINRVLERSVIKCQAYSDAQTRAEHGKHHSVIRSRLRRRMRAAHLSTAPETLRLGLDLGVSQENELRELKSAVAETSQPHLGRPRRCRRDWVTTSMVSSWMKNPTDKDRLLLKHQR